MANYYITDAIPYTNAQAHIGHALEFVQSDFLARYHRLNGDQVILTHGADEHGTKNYKKALELGRKPQEFVDEITKQFQEAHVRLNVQFDRFVKTSSKEHAVSVHAVWKKLLEKDLIYKDSYHGWYCVGCEEFVTEAAAKENNYNCPIHKAKYEELEEENYFFKLSAFTKQIQQEMISGHFNITPDNRKQEITALLSSGLDDISVSRPKEKLPWGVAVPNDPDHVIYVWFEALINYITALGYPKAGEMDLFWPADVQIIGKDIIRFHAAIWPAMLLGLDLKPPKNLVVHGMIQSGGHKMSKSLGNVIDPFEVIDEYGTDALRYFLLRHIPSGEDGDFTWQRFERAYNGELANDLGNLVQRLSAMISRYQDGIIGEIPTGQHDEGLYHQALAEFKFERSLQAVWNMIAGINQYLEETKPWEISKQPNTKEHLQEVLATAVGSLLQVAKLLKPALPATAEAIERVFNGGVINKLDEPLFPRKYLYNPDPNAS